MGAKESEPACESARGAIFGYGVETTRTDLLWEDQRGAEVIWGGELDAVGDGTWSRFVRLFARRCYYWRSRVVINETWTPQTLHMKTLVSNAFAGLDLELSVDARGNVVNTRCWSLRTLRHSFNLPDKTSELAETASGSQYSINIQYLHLDPSILHLHTIETIATIIGQVHIRLHTYCRLQGISIRIRRKGAHFAIGRHRGTCFFVYSFAVARNLALSVLST